MRGTDTWEELFDEVWTLASMISFPFSQLAKRRLIAHHQLFYLVQCLANIFRIG